jgi:branched-chain amino acid transport system ATP-binding protein
MLDVKDLHTWYGQSYALQGTSLTVDSGKCVAVLGRNGVGKTTLMNSIAGFIKAGRGEVLFRDEKITDLTADRIVRRRLALVPQGRRVFGSLTVLENLRVAADHTANRSRIEDQLQTVFAYFPGLLARKSSLGRDLSGGEQQMLAIGRALMTGPDMLLLDEPTEGLAPAIVQQLQKDLAALKDRGMTILLAEQNLKFALALADYVYIMTTKGQIVFSGSCEDLTADDETHYRYLGVSA